MAWMDEIDFSREPNSKEWVGMCRRNQARWDAHNTGGKMYILDIENRSISHKFQVHQIAKNAWQAALRYYKGLDHQVPAWTWKCTKVVKATLKS